MTTHSHASIAARVLGILLGCWLTVAAPAGIARDAPSDEVAVAAVIRSLQEHWNRGDMSAYLERYEQQDTLRLTFGNTIVKGWSAMETLFRSSYPDPERMGRFTIDRLETRIIDADTAVAHGNFTHVFPHQTIKGGFTQVLHRSSPDGWVIVHERTSRGEVIETPQGVSR